MSTHNYKSKPRAASLYGQIQHRRFIQYLPFTHFTFCLQQGETWLQLSLSCLWFSSCSVQWVSHCYIFLPLFPLLTLSCCSLRTLLWNILLVQFRLQSFAPVNSTSTLQGSPSHCLISLQCHENMFIQKSKCQVIPSHCITPRPFKNQAWRVDSFCKGLI